MANDAVVLLSGGQDSTTCLFWAKERFDTVYSLSVFYGQRHQAELDAAREIAAMAGTPHEVVEMPSLQRISSGSALVNAALELRGDGGLGDKTMPNGLPTSFVPGRNLMFLSLASSYAVKVGAKTVVTGVCQTDYSGYPDCRHEFIEAFAEAATRAMPSDCGPLQVHTPLMHLTKAETVHLAASLGGDAWQALGRSLTCYNGQRPGCGKCPACELRAAGFADAGVQDPADVA